MSIYLIYRLLPLSFEKMHGLLLLISKLHYLGSAELALSYAFLSKHLLECMLAITYTYIHTFSVLSNKHNPLL